MSSPAEPPLQPENPPREPRPRWWLHLLLFGLTVVCTTFAGAEWIYGKGLWMDNPTLRLEWRHWVGGLHYSVPFLLILTVHEFGHYFTARYYRLKVSLPFYIPFWLGFLGVPSFSLGTMGAFIRIREAIQSRQVFFDVGLAGPLAGFVVAVAVLWYGFANLPPADYIFQFHPEYRQFGVKFYEKAYQNLPEGSLILLGDNLLFWFFREVVADPARVPHPNEMIHYPYLMAGYLALFFTALNLVPIGQLDGGHILYGLIGAKRHRAVSAALFVGFIFYAGLGLFSPHPPAPGTLPEGVGPNADLYSVPFYLLFLYLVFSRVVPSRTTVLLLALGVFAGQYLTSFLFPQAEGYQGWLLFGLLLGRFLGIYHPPTPDDQPLNRKRKWLGWLALLIFVLCFSPQPLMIK
jgi:membrane-associated protease RseP (regulator of RpoE activity)